MRICRVYPDQIQSLGVDKQCLHDMTAWKYSCGGYKRVWFKLSLLFTYSPRDPTCNHHTHGIIDVPFALQQPHVYM